MIERDRLVDNLQRVQAAITEAAQRAGRDPRDVRIVAVTKGVDRRSIALAYEAGLRLFGENRVQEAKQKFLSAPLPPDAELHLIGHLQTNKVRDAVTLFSMIHSVDRPGLVTALAKRLNDRTHRLPILIQVNVSGEPQKHGCSVDELFTLAETILQYPTIELRGLMTIAPLTDDRLSIRRVFRRLRELRDELALRIGRELPELSMGMSNDFEIAVEEGATLVRIGRALFGA